MATDCFLSNLPEVYFSQLDHWLVTNLNFLDVNQALANSNKMTVGPTV